MIIIYGSKTYNDIRNILFVFDNNEGILIEFDSLEYFLYSLDYIW